MILNNFYQSLPDCLLFCLLDVQKMLEPIKSDGLEEFLEGLWKEMLENEKKLEKMNK